MKILIIDDDTEYVGSLSTLLRLEGFTVQSTLAGATGLELARQFVPDLILLDILLPDANGWEICEQLRAFSDAPILMMSAIATDVQDQVQGLNLGADDYVCKPIDFHLLKARILAVLRRSASASGEDCRVYADECLEIDLRREYIAVKGQPVHLSHQEYQLLALLVSNQDQTVPTLEIIEDLWPGVSDQDGMCHVHTYVKRLRRIIEPDRREPSYIVNEYGFGYRFCTRQARTEFVQD